MNQVEGNSMKNDTSDLSSKLSISDTADDLIKDVPRPKNAIFIERLIIKPTEQKRIPLGSFTEEKTPKGFLVEIDPDPSPLNSVVTNVITLGDSRRYSLHLNIANFSSKSVHAEVWRL
jgi:hypothetical protein